MTTDLCKLFERDLNRLLKETEAFTKEENLWKTSGSISNSAGNLALHLAGNLQHFVGYRLGNSSYERNREAEFSTRNLPKAELLEQLQQTKTAVTEALQNLAPEKLNQQYPESPFGYDMSVGFFLVHLSGHLNYHLGQINYLRRVLEPATVPA